MAETMRAHALCTGFLIWVAACGNGVPAAEIPTPSVAASRSEVIAADRTPIAQLDDPADVLKLHPPFKVVPRTETLSELPTFPCTTCHDGDTVKADPSIRELDEEHTDIKLAHGGGRYWCHTCHNVTDYDSLTSLKGKKISFDQPFLLCGQCHFRTQLDYFRGAHGKRVSGWNEERTILACPACHNPHGPQIPARMPAAVPKVRKGLSRSQPAHAETTPRGVNRIVGRRQGE